jgi:anti-sigma regulatory factor (Ser/Thr protein kinase)
MGSPVPNAPSPVGPGERYRLVIPSQVALVGDTVDTVAACCFAGSSPSRRTRFRLCTVVAEALANAMLYGNRGESDRQVIVEIVLGADRIVIAVTDEGDGFDPDTVAMPEGDAVVEATRGRGLFLIRRLADAVAFNAQGNTIWITLLRT